MGCVLGPHVWEGGVGRQASVCCGRVRGGQRRDGGDERGRAGCVRKGGGMSRDCHPRGDVRVVGTVRERHRAPAGERSGPDDRGSLIRMED